MTSQPLSGRASASIAAVACLLIGASWSVAVLDDVVDAADAPSIFVVDMHSHTEPGPHAGDNGKESLASQAERGRAAGYHAVFHTPHSDLITDAQSWADQQAYERDGDWALTRYLGEEVTVEKGPQWGKATGRANNDHLGVVGQDAYIDHALPMKASCERAHAAGAVVTLNHPGPGPSMWEAGYWDRPGLRDKIDAIEVCNGQIMHVLPLDSFALYLRATKYSGWGVKLAAVGGTDSHSPTAVPEIATLIVAASDAETDLVEAVRLRKTYVAYRLLDLRLRCDQLGETLLTGDVDLALDLSRKVKRITLYREGRSIQNWTDTDHAEFKETITENAAYAWRVMDGKARAYSSAIWYEPEPIALPDLVVDMDECALRGRKLTVGVANVGRVAARDVVVEAWSGFSKSGTETGAGTNLLGRHTFADVAVDGRAQIVFTLKSKPTRAVFIRVDPEGYGLDDEDAIPELDERNNCALLHPSR